MNVRINLFAPSTPHKAQQIVLDALDGGERFVGLRAGRKWRKTSLGISWLFEQAITKNLTSVYIAPNRVQAKNIAWDDHVKRILDELQREEVPYKTNETELSIDLPRGKVQLLGVDNAEALRGISNWGAVFCFVAGTKITTDRGEINIEDVMIGDKAYTPSGYAPITRNGKSGECRSFISVTLSTGQQITGTPNHKVFTNRGLVSLDELRYNDIIWTKTYHSSSSLITSAIGYRNAKRIGDTTVVEEIKLLITYIKRYGGIKMEKCLRGILSTTLTKIGLITGYLTSLAFLSQNTVAYTHLTDGIHKKTKCLQPQEKTLKKLSHILGQRQGKSNQEKISSLPRKGLSFGMVAKKVTHGTRKELYKIGRIGKRLINVARNVASHILHTTRKGLNTAPHIVEIKNLSYKENLPVYNLTVDKQHCYYADGILVSNCDEYDDWDNDIWKEVIRPNLITHKSPALISGTPKGFRNLYRLENGGIFKFFHFTSMDNPEIDRQELEDMKKEYSEMGMGAYRQEILAEYEKPEGTVYEEWDMDRQFVDVSYNPTLPLHLAWDFGVNDPTVILFLQTKGEEIRLIDYYEAGDANIKHFTEWITSRGYREPEFEAGDIAGRARTLLTGKTVINELRELGHSIRSMAIPDIDTQIRHAHRFIPKLYVSKSNPNCLRFRDCIINYRYPKKADNLVNQENENPIHDEYSHAMRAFEYYCWNLTGGAVGAINKKSNNKTMQHTAVMRNGRQVVFDLDKFADAYDGKQGGKI